jgi:hypothetical protein
MTEVVRHVVTVLERLLGAVLVTLGVRRAVEAR